ncbi:hypothetical protein GGR54DRAFT_642414 [Hypoxylon sp. NC1633]|nr:hypothetical protein GGR54DRAFT_642414 [Hypoxylon sp. NC1633]
MASTTDSLTTDSLTTDSLTPVPIYDAASDVNDVNQKAKFLTYDDTETPPPVKFAGAKILFQSQIQSGRDDDVLVVTDVTLEQFELIEKARDKYGRKTKFHYRAGANILIITIPTGLHEGLHLELYEGFVRRVPIDSWTSKGGKTFKTSDHPGGPDGGEGDSTGGPVPARVGLNKWPSFVIEAGHSSSISLLRTKMRWWFSASNHDVKLVLLAKSYRAEY